MPGKYGLYTLEAYCKALDIVKRNAVHVTGEDKESELKIHFEYLVAALTDAYADTALEKLSALEENRVKLLEEISFMIKLYLMQTQCLNHAFRLHKRINIADDIRFEQLLTKYKLETTKSSNGETCWDMTPISIAFPDLENEVIKKNSTSLGLMLPDVIKKYKNFKREFAIEGILALLPAGKKYGGFIKALLHFQLIDVSHKHPEMLICRRQMLTVILTKLRATYHSNIFSEEKRLEWFEKLNIKADDDCALWSRLFDQQFPNFKHIHKFFDQLA